METLEIYTSINYNMRLKYTDTHVISGLYLICIQIHKKSTRQKGSGKVEYSFKSQEAFWRRDEMRRYIHTDTTTHTPTHTHTNTHTHTHTLAHTHKHKHTHTHTERERERRGGEERHRERGTRKKQQKHRVQFLLPPL